MQYIKDDPYEYGRQHEQVLDFIYNYFKKSDMIDCFDLFKTYCNIMSYVNQGKMDEIDWRKMIINLYKRKKKDERRNK